MYNSLRVYRRDKKSQASSKIILLSFWFGFDVLALSWGACHAQALIRYSLPIFFLAAFLISGTVFSVLFCWASWFFSTPGKIFFVRTLWHLRLTGMMQERSRLMVLGVLLSSSGIVAMAGYLHQLHQLHFEVKPSYRVALPDPAMVKKCAELAQLEHQLFETGSKSVMAACLLQYDEKYASLRKLPMQQ